MPKIEGIIIRWLLDNPLFLDAIYASIELDALHFHKLEQDGEHILSPPHQHAHNALIEYYHALAVAISAVENIQETEIYPIQIKRIVTGLKNAKTE